MKIHTDCRHYHTSRPCGPHKQSRVCCDSCTTYAPVEERVLVVKLDAMGDVLRTTACLDPLRRLHPRSHVTWVTRRESLRLLSGNPRIDRVLTVDSSYLEFLLAERFDLALGPDTDLLAASIMRIATATEKRGFVGDGRGGVVPQNEAAWAWWRMGQNDTLKRRNRRSYGEWLYAICELPGPVARPSLPVSAGATEAAQRFLAARSPGAVRRVCVNAGGSERWREKRWKVEYFRELGRLLQDADPVTAAVLVGGPREAEFTRAVLQAGAGFIDGGTDRSVDEFAALIACCDWMLTSDSLGYHVACAVGTPALCLVGPTSPWELDRYGTNAVVHADLDCIACYLAACPLTSSCMDRLTPKKIWPIIDRANRWGAVGGEAVRGPAGMAEWLGSASAAPHTPVIRDREILNAPCRDHAD